MRRALFPLVFFAAAVSLHAQQPPPPLPPAVGNAVLLATHSIQVDRDVIVHSGDLVVNDALGTLTLDQGVTTPAGFAVKADSVTLNGPAIVNGNVHANTLTNDGGTIGGNTITPLPLPVIPQLPALLDRVPTAEDINVAAGEVRIIGRGDYGALNAAGIVRLPGGPYTFTSITLARGARVIWDGPGDVVVKGNLILGAEVDIVAAPGVTTKRKMFFVHGGVTIGRDCTVNATVHAPNGAIVAGQSLSMLGSFVARDIRIGRDSRLTVRSGFRNLPPVAVNQTVIVRGEEPVPITLNGFDPDSDPLIFTIAVPPQNGTLSPVQPTGPTSAVVVYTQRADPDDVFVFRVTDSEGFVAQGVVTINAGLPPPGPPTTIIAENSQVEVPPGRPTILTLIAIGPPGVPITVSIPPEGAPANGNLGPLTQPSFMPPRPAQVVYIPDPGFIGDDLIRFVACGIINGEQVCDEGVVRIAVVGAEPPPELAPDITTTANAGALLAIPLPAGPPPPPGPSILTPALVAGTTADGNGDGLGDSTAIAPAIAAGFGGEAGTVRIQLEWNIANLASIASNLQSATILLRTRRDEGDNLTTFFHAVGSNGDGQLTANDFERSAEILPQGTMPVTAPGTFSFDILAELKDALANGYTHLAIQGRVNEPEEAEGAESGLHVLTDGPGGPQLGVAQFGAITRTFRILSLPSNGTLRDANGNVIAAVPYTLPTPAVSYQSASGFAGTVTFGYEVTNGPAADTGTVTVNVIGGDGDGR